MKGIKIFLLSDIGRKAYEENEKKGLRLPYLERKLMRKLFKEKKEGDIITITTPAQAMAVQINLDEKVRQGMAKYGAEDGKDYKIEVLWGDEAL